MSIEGKDRNRGEGLVSPDRSRFLWVDPDELIIDNPAALIVNKDTYEGMVAHFSEERFRNSPPEVAWVEIYLPTGATKRLLVVDGLTRTKFSSDHKGKILKEAPRMNFNEIRVFNITPDLLKDPRIMLIQEYQEGRDSLTTLQYLRAIIKPTIAHTEIAPDRIAGHLLNTWVGTVGPNLAERFPGLSALSFLANPRITITPDRELKKALARQEQLVAKETGDERKILEKALRDQAAVILMSGIQRGDIARQAYFLVGSGSAVIGGTQETRGQIFPLLRSNAFEKKLAKEYSSHLGEAENIRSEFTRALEEAFVRLSDGSMDNDRSLADVKHALDDESLTVDQTMQIIAASSPSRQYSEIKRDINRQALREKYQVTVGKKGLTEIEQTLINNLGGQTYPSESGIHSAVREIQSCVVFLCQSRNWQEQLKVQFDDWVKQGVEAPSVNQAIAQISQKQVAVMTSNSLDALRTRTKELQKTVAEFRDKMAKDILLHSAREAVNTVFNRELRTAPDPQFVEGVARAILNDEDFDTRRPDEYVLKWVRQFKRLEPDIQTEVIAGHIRRIVTAINIQNRRQVVDTAPKAEAKTGEKSADVRPVPSEVNDIAKTPSQAELIPPQTRASQEEIKRRRIEMSIKRLSEVIEAHIVPVIRILATIDLDSQEVPDYLKKILGEAEIIIERKRGGHPDVVRVMDETYPNSQKEIAKLRETILNIQRQQSDRDTYTKQ